MNRQGILWVVRWLAAVLVVSCCGLLGWAAMRTWRANADVSIAQDLALRQGSRPAIPYLDLATRYRPDRAKTWRLLSELSAFAHPHTALGYARRAVAKDPANWRNWDQLGLVEFQLGDSSAARRALARSVRRDSGWEAHYQLGNLALLLGRKQEFWEQIRAALAVVPPSQAAPVLNQAFSTGRGGAEAAGGGRTMPQGKAAAASVPRWLAFLPANRPPVEAVAVQILLSRGRPLLAAAVWSGVRCASYQRRVCRSTSLGLANRLAELAFRGEALQSVDNGAGKAPRVAPPEAGILARAAARVWNTAVQRGWLRRTLAAAGRVNDGNFQQGWLGPAFSWTKIGSVYTSIGVGMGPGQFGNAVRLDFTGYQPQRTALLRQFVRVRPRVRYRLMFVSRRVRPGGETGVRLEVTAGRGRILLRLPALLRSHWSENAGSFRTPPGVSLVQLTFVYRRPLGQTRLHNPVLLADVAMRALVQ